MYIFHAIFDILVFLQYMASAHIRFNFVFNAQLLFLQDRRFFRLSSLNESV